MSRTYEKKLRAARQAATRQRIVEATVRLHGTVGPARTAVSAIAEMAGVERVTVYRHFPDPASLFRACRDHFMRTTPPPDDAWREVKDPDARLRAGLAALYKYYADNEKMVANIFRDSEIIPVGNGFVALKEAIVRAISAAWEAGERRSSKRALAVLDVVADFQTWRNLVRRMKLSPDEAIELAATWVSCVRDRAGVPAPRALRRAKAR